MIKYFFALAAALSSPIPARPELFSPKNRPAFLYKGPIVEASVYRSVIDAWFAKPSAEDAAFLPGQVHATLCK